MRPSDLDRICNFTILHLCTDFFQKEKKRKRNICTFWKIASRQTYGLQNIWKKVKSHSEIQNTNTGIFAKKIVAATTILRLRTLKLRRSRYRRA